MGSGDVRGSGGVGQTGKMRRLGSSTWGGRICRRPAEASREPIGDSEGGSSQGRRWETLPPRRFAFLIARLFQSTRKRGSEEERTVTVTFSPHEARQAQFGQNPFQLGPFSHIPSAFLQNTRNIAENHMSM
jgi:hypothetical protein